MRYGKKTDYDALCESFDWNGVPVTYVKYGSHTGWDKFERLGIPSRFEGCQVYAIPTDRAQELRDARKGYRCSGMPSILRDQTPEGVRNYSIRRAMGFAGFSVK